MSAFDGLLAVTILLLSLTGWRRGTLGTALPIIGCVAGLWVGGLVLGDPAGWSSLLSLVWLICFVLGGSLVARRLQRLIESRRGPQPLRRFERAGGALLGALLGAFVTAILGFSLLQQPHEMPLRRAAENSLFLREASENGPTGALARGFSGLAGLQVAIFPNVAAPDPQILKKGPVRASIDGHVALVAGESCGVSTYGTGVMVGPETLVTAAHVVAGVDPEGILVLPEGQSRATLGRVVYFNPATEVAIVRVPGVSSSPLGIAGKTRRGEPVAIAGYGGEHGLMRKPGRLGDSQGLRSRDVFGRIVTRDVEWVRGDAIPGDSGGPIFDDRGRLVGITSSLARHFSNGLYIVPGPVIASALSELGTRDRTVTSSDRCPAE